MSIETVVARGIGRVLPTPWGGPALRLPLPEEWRGFASHPATLLGLVLLLPIVAAAIAGPWLPMPDPNQPNIHAALQGPSAGHLFGTDALGRDLLARVVAGARVSLTIGFSVAAIAVVLGMAIGMVSVFGGRLVEGTITGVVDLLLSFPSLLLAIAFVAVFSGGVTQVIIALALADIPRAIRLQRSLALAVKSSSYIDAARMFSSPTWWLIVRHVLPNTVASMLVVGASYAANAILAEAALSFLGLGIIPPQASWGNIISDGRLHLQEAWWICVFPGLAIVLSAISLHLLSDSFRISLDPRAEA